MGIFFLCVITRLVEKFNEFMEFFEVPALVLRLRSQKDGMMKGGPSCLNG